MHDYLGMVLKLSDPGKVKVEILDYVANIFQKVPHDMDVEAATL